MSIFDKNRIKSGQQGMEYIIITALVMAGIIISSPYVIRSWNAQMKGWEDAAIDSLQDPLLTSIPKTTPIAGCDQSSTWNNMGCGGGTFDPCDGTTFSCGPEEMLQENTYTPAGCQCSLPTPVSTGNYLQCKTDSSFDCCSAWDYDDTDDLVPDPPVSRCGANASPPCPDREYRRNRTCDGEESETECAPSPICDFYCIEPPTIGSAPLYGSLCSGGDVDLTSDLNYTLVSNDACSSTKCEYQCGPGAKVVGSGSTSTCVTEDCGACSGEGACASYTNNGVGCLATPGCAWVPANDCCGTCTGEYGAVTARCSATTMPPLVNCSGLSQWTCSDVGCSWDTYRNSCREGFGVECSTITSNWNCVGGCTWTYASTNYCWDDYFGDVVGCRAHDGCTWTPEPDGCGCWDDIVETTDTTMSQSPAEILFGNIPGSGGCSDIKYKGDPKCWKNRQSFPGCPSNCDSDYQQVSDHPGSCGSSSGDCCQDKSPWIGSKWHHRHRWNCINRAPQTRCWKDSCNPNYWTVPSYPNGKVNASGVCDTRH